MDKNKRADSSIELKSIKNHKFGNLFVKQTLEDQFNSILKLKDKNKDKFEREINNLRIKLTEYLSIQEENKKISEDNIEIFIENVIREEENIEISNNNKKYLMELFEKINDLK